MPFPAKFPCPIPSARDGALALGALLSLAGASIPYQDPTPAAGGPRLLPLPLLGGCGDPSRMPHPCRHPCCDDAPASMIPCRPPTGDRQGSSPARRQWARTPAGSPRAQPRWAEARSILREWRICFLNPNSPGLRCHPPIPSLPTESSSTGSAPKPSPDPRIRRFQSLRSRQPSFQRRLGRKPPGSRNRLASSPWLGTAPIFRGA